MSSGDFKTVPCKGCGRKIIWAAVGTQMIPLDASAPVYSSAHRHGRYGCQEFERDNAAFVSHFVTCPQRDLFSKGKSKGDGS